MEDIVNKEVKDLDPIAIENVAKVLSLDNNDNCGLASVDLAKINDIDDKVTKEIGKSLVLDTDITQIGENKLPDTPSDAVKKFLNGNKEWAEIDHSYLTIADTMTANELPSHYRSNFPNKVIYEAKLLSVLGISDEHVTASVGVCETIIPYSTTRGGAVMQVFRCNNQDTGNEITFRRTGYEDDSAWNDWTLTGYQMSQETGDSEIKVMSQKSITDITNLLVNAIQELENRETYIEGAVFSSELDPVAVRKVGDGSIIKKMTTYLVTANSDSSLKIIGALEKNNHFKFQNGGYAPVEIIPETEEIEYPWQTHEDKEYNLMTGFDKQVYVINYETDEDNKLSYFLYSYSPFSYKGFTA
ncbi:MAG: hypothetical protein WCR80_06110, partial [Bacilli bacterium]